MRRSNGTPSGRYAHIFRYLRRNQCWQGKTRRIGHRVNIFIMM